jgi:hypothetical protein
MTARASPIRSQAYLDAVGGTIPVIQSEQLVADIGSVQTAFGSLADPAPARVALAHA